MYNVGQVLNFFKTLQVRVSEAFLIPHPVLLLLLFYNRPGEGFKKRFKNFPQVSK
jgi:hypothetical protein